MGSDSNTTEQNAPVDICVSHIAEEKDLAVGIKMVLDELLVSPARVFVSSDPLSVLGGVRYEETLRDALDSARLLIMLCSPESLKHPWIYFEFGVAWNRMIPVLPICHSGISEAELIQALSSYQARRLDDEGFVQGLAVAIHQHLGIGSRANADYAMLHSMLLDAVPPQAEFLWLLAPGPQKIQVIKEIRRLTMFGLKDSKDLVDAAPRHIPLRSDGSSEKTLRDREMSEAAAALQAVGASVELRPMPGPEEPKRGSGIEGGRKSSDVGCLVVLVAVALLGYLILSR